MFEFRPRNFMLLPTMECQASCRYCFGPNQGETMLCVGEAIDFIENIAPEDGSINLTFHGGEPLLAEKGYYEYILPMLRERFGLRLRLSLQSNLWALTDEMIDLIRKYDIRIGTSLDGFEEMCDVQRGREYFQKTMDGIRRLRENGIDTHCICTFTPAFADRAREVFDFFAHEHIPYAIHGAVQPMNSPPSELTVSADDMAKVLLDTLAVYRERTSSNRVGTIDSMVKGCFDRKGSVCTFFNCLGKFAAVAPDGGIYSCQRFCGKEEYLLGNVRDLPSETDIVNSAAFRRLAEKQQNAETTCGTCLHTAYCHGGCLYNMLTEGSEKDPYCGAYQAVFDTIAQEMALEMGGVMTKRLSEKEAPMLAMAGDLPHPFDQEVNRYKRKWALKWGQKWAPDYIRQDRLNKLYLHITFACPLRCDHCYARGGEREMPEMSAQDIWSAVQAAQQNGFHAVVITGGEPLIHGDIDNVLAWLRDINLKGMRLSLRTSLGFDIEKDRLAVLGDVFSEIIVSIDGDKTSHDARRGQGFCEKAVSNLQLLKELGCIEKVGLCATLAKSLRDGPEGAAVYALAKQLGIEKVRLRPILPLGRSESAPRSPSTTSTPNTPNTPNTSNTSNTSNTPITPITPCEEDFLCGGESDITSAFAARYTCGLGQNLYIEPDGGAYPCYAWCGPDKLLGNIRDGLESILQNEAFKDLSRHHVDTNEKCKGCRVRYLCGGMCKAWIQDKENPDSGEFDCSARKAMLLRLAERL